MSILIYTLSLKQVIKQLIRAKSCIKVFAVVINDCCFSIDLKFMLANIVLAHFIECFPDSFIFWYVVEAV